MIDHRRDDLMVYVFNHITKKLDHSSEYEIELTASSKELLDDGFKPVRQVGTIMQIYRKDNCVDNCMYVKTDPESLIYYYDISTEDEAYLMNMFNYLVLAELLNRQHTSEEARERLDKISLYDFLMSCGHKQEVLDSLTSGRGMKNSEMPIITTTIELFHCNNPMGYANLGNHAFTQIKKRFKELGYNWH